MPEMQIGRRVVDAVRLTLRPEEAEDVLELKASRVRKMVRQGLLSDVSSSRSIRIDPSEVAALVADKPLALSRLAAIVAGENHRDEIAQ